MRVHVYIATTLGPVKIQGFRPIAGRLLSHVGIDGISGHQASISSAYHEFVKPGVGVIADEFGGGSWRMDISDEIDDGRSWQLGVYLAHWLNERENLADGDPAPGDHVVWATGEVSIHRRVRSIDGLQDKIDFSLSDVARWQAAGIGITALAPEVDVRTLSPENAPRVDVEGLTVLGISDVGGARDAINDALRVPADGPAEPTAAVTLPPSSRTVPTDRSGPQLKLGEIVLDQYEIKSLLGAGGMSEVYRAEHLGLNRQPRAIKVMDGSWSDDGVGTQFMMREAEALLRVTHPAVVRCHDLHVDKSGRCYLVMEMVEGRSLADEIARGPLSIAQVTRLGARLADGLVAAHAAGVIHRDVSPDNVVLRNGNVDEATLIDFGVAKVPQKREGTVLEGFKGKYNYASPEQLGYFGGHVDGRSDFYSLGLVLVAAATGKPLDMGKTAVEAVKARDGLDTLPTDIPLGLRSAIEPLLALDPADRPSDPMALFASRGSGEVDATQVPSDAPSQALRGRLAIAVVGALAATSAGIWVFTDRGVPAFVEPITAEDGAALPDPTAITEAAEPGDAPTTDFDGTVSVKPAVDDPEPTASLPASAPPESTAQTEPDAPPPTDQPRKLTASERIRIVGLLNNAALALEDGRLMKPERDNAFDRYEAVLTLDPMNATALAGKADIARRYLALASEARAKDDMPSARRYEDLAATADPAVVRASMEGG